MQDFLIMNSLGYPILSLLVFLPLAGVIPLLLLKGKGTEVSVNTEDADVYFEIK